MLSDCCRNYNDIFKATHTLISLQTIKKNSTMKSGLFVEQGYPQWPKMSDCEIGFFLQSCFQSRSTPLFMIG